MMLECQRHRRFDRTLRFQLENPMHFLPIFEVGNITIQVVFLI